MHRISFVEPRIRGLIESVRLQPLVMRELQEGLRRKSTLRLRKAFGGGSLALLTWILLVWPSDSAGHQIFQLFSGLSFAACLVAGIFLGGDSLSKERREGTLPFLFLSSLTSGEVVTGKFAAHCIVPVFTLLGMLPSFTVCLLIGGVTGSEVFRTMLAIPAVLLWAMALSVLTSSYCSDQRVAYSTALITIIAILAGCPALSAILGGPGGGWAPFLIAALSPSVLLLNANAAHYFANTALFWASLGVALLSAYGFLAWAAAHLTRSWRGAAPKTKRDANAAEALQARCYRRIATGNAIAWLVSRYRAKSIFPVLFPALGLALWVASVWYTGTIYTVRRGGLYILVVYTLVLLQLLHVAFKVWIASAATQVFSADRRSGALEMLLGSRLSSQEIALGVVGGLKKRFGVPTAFLLATDLLFAFRAFQLNDILLGLGSVMLGLLLCVDVYALIWGGLIEGLLAKTPFGGLVMTLWRLVIIPGALFGLLPAILFGRSVLAGLSIWFVLALATTFGALHAMKQQYLPHFRTFALQFYGEKIREVESPWSFMNWEEEEPMGEPLLVQNS